VIVNIALRRRTLHCAKMLRVRNKYVNNQFPEMHSQTPNISASRGRPEHEWRYRTPAAAQLAGRTSSRDFVNRVRVLLLHGERSKDAATHPNFKTGRRGLMRRVTFWSVCEGAQRNTS
jgi:hypothetical protein